MINYPFEMISIPLFVSQMTEGKLVSGLTIKQHLYIIAAGTFQEDKAAVQRSSVRTLLFISLLQSNGCVLNVGMEGPECSD